MVRLLSRCVGGALLEPFRTKAPPSPLEPGGRCASEWSLVELSLSFVPERQELYMADCIPAEAWEQLSDGVWPALLKQEGVPERLFRRA